MVIKKFLRRIIRWINAASSASSEEIEESLKKRGVKLGSNVHFYDSFIDSKYGPLIEIGDNVTITNASILAHDASTKKEIGYSKIGKVRIGNNVFVGYGSIVLPGTTIGDNCIVGAGTVVRGNVQSGSVIIGNPCRVVCSYDEYIEANRNRFDSSLLFDENKLEELDKAAGVLNDRCGFVV